MLMKWNPYKEIERTFDDLFDRGLFLHPLWDDRSVENVETAHWRPAVNVYEDKDTLHIEAQLPGVDMKDIELSVSDHTLQVRGERKVEHEENKDGYHFKEARYGTIARSFSLPSYVDPGQAKATYDRGVLTITVPKQEKVKPRAIPIEAK